MAVSVVLRLVCLLALSACPIGTKEHANAHRLRLPIGGTAMPLFKNPKVSGFWYEPVIR